MSCTLRLPGIATRWRPSMEAQRLCRWRLFSKIIPKEKSRVTRQITARLSFADEDAIHEPRPTQMSLCGKTCMAAQRISKSWWTWSKMAQRRREGEKPPEKSLQMPCTTLMRWRATKSGGRQERRRNLEHQESRGASRGHQGSRSH